MLTSNLKKRLATFLSSLAVFSLIAQPLMVVAQSNGWDVTSMNSYQVSNSFDLDLADPTDLYYAPFENAYNSDIFTTDDGTNPFSPNRSLQERKEKDKNSDKGEAQRLKEQQKKDMEECIKKNGMNPGFGAFGSASDVIEGGVNRIFDSMSENIKNDIKDEIENVIKDGLKEELENTVKNSIKELLKQRLQAELPQILSQVIQSRLASGQEVTPEYLNQVLPTEINVLIVNNLPSITSQALRAGIPTAMGNLLEENLPNIISQSVRNQFSGTLSQMPQLLQNNISDDLDSFMRFQIGQSTTNTVVGEAQFAGINQTLMTQLTGTITSQLSGSMDSIVSQMTQQISSSIELDTSEMDSVINSITDDITSQFSDLTDQIADEMSAQLDNSISQVTDQLSSSLDQIIDPITNSLDDMVGQILDPITASLDGMINGVVESITGSFTSVLDGITTSLTNQIQDITNSIVESVTEPITNAITGVTDSIVQNVTEPITNAINNVTGQLTSSITGAVTGMIPGISDITGMISLRVPTNSWEQADSYLSQKTEAIRKEEVEMKKNLIQICMQEKAVKRIQQALEKKEFVEDPKARRQAKTEIEEHRQELDQLAKEGFEVGDGGTESLVPANINSHVKLYVDEATKLYLKELSNSGNVNDDKIANQLYYQYNKGPLDNLKSTISQQDYQILAKPDPSKGDEYWKAWLKALEPQNNYKGSLLIAQQQLSGRQTLAEQNAREELLAGEGFRPIRKCKSNVGGQCKEWETITPGSVVKDTLSDSMQYRTEQYTEAREYGDIAPGNEPTSQELRTFTPSTQGGGGGRGSLASFGLDMIFNLASQFLGNGGLDNVLGNNSQQQENAPTLTFSFTSPSWLSISNGTSSNSAILKWTSVNAEKCVADNSWYGKQDENSNKTVKNTGDNLNTQGSQIIDFPLNVSLNMTRSRGGVSSDIKKTSGPNANLTSKITTFELNNTDFQTGDIINISSGNSSVSVTLSSTGTSTIVSAVRSKIQTLNLTSEEYKEFSKYNLNYNTSLGKISAEMLPVYKIKCTKGTKDIVKSVNITR